MQGKLQCYWTAKLTCYSINVPDGSTRNPNQKEGTTHIITCPIAPRGDRWRYYGNNQSLIRDTIRISIFAIYQTLKQMSQTDKEVEVRQWVEEVVGEKFSDPNNWQESLKDGLLLCKLINKIQEGKIKKVNKMKMPFMMMENINAFLTAARELGVPEFDLFVTVDLFEGKNIPQVVQCLYSLGRRCHELPNYNGPKIGPKTAEKNVRQFSEEQIREATNAVPILFAPGATKGHLHGHRELTHADVVRVKDPNAVDKK